MWRPAGGKWWGGGWKGERSKCSLQDPVGVSERGSDRKSSVRVPADASAQLWQGTVSSLLYHNVYHNGTALYHCRR